MGKRGLIKLNYYIWHTLAMFLLLPIHVTLNFETWKWEPTNWNCSWKELKPDLQWNRCFASVSLGMYSATSNLSSPSQQQPSKFANLWLRSSPTALASSYSNRNLKLKELKFSYWNVKNNHSISNLYTLNEKKDEASQCHGPSYFYTEVFIMILQILWKPFSTD